MVGVLFVFLLMLWTVLEVVEWYFVMVVLKYCSAGNYCNFFLW